MCTEINGTGSVATADTITNGFYQPSKQPNPDHQPLVGDLSFHGPLDKTIHDLLGNFATISEQRREKLNHLAGVISTQRAAGQTVKLLFICTHNSRRSHMGQIWAATAAAFCGVTGVSTYSGGTEVSSFHHRAVAALQRAGFGIKMLSSSTQPLPENPRYQVSFSNQKPAMTVFSKKYDDPPNPEKGFVAIMACHHANNTCPAIAGASSRIALPWVDPKETDNTREADSHYDERVRQIGSEMLYLFTKVSTWQK